jgi:hypothetical protein
MKKLKFIRDVAVGGIHREQGSVHDIEDRDAAILIADGAAILAAEPIEKATAKPAKETAARR